MAAISPATEPTTNQMDVSPTVMASTTPKITMAAIQISVIISVLPPFRHSPSTRARARVTATAPMPSHFSRGARLAKNADSAVFRVFSGSGALGTSCTGASRGTSWENSSSRDT